MHAEAKEYAARWSSNDPATTVVELGSRNTSGDRVRDLFLGTRYIGIDAVHGDDVDIVANAAEWLPAEPADLVLCCELFEHTPRWREIVVNVLSMLRPGGRAVFTCAGPGRAVHGVNHDDPDDPGWYQNVSASEIEHAMVTAGYQLVESEQVVHRSTFLGGTDTRASGVRPA